MIRGGFAIALAFTIHAAPLSAQATTPEATPEPSPTMFTHPESAYPPVPNSLLIPDTTATGGRHWFRWDVFMWTFDEP